MEDQHVLIEALSTSGLLDVSHLSLKHISGAGQLNTGTLWSLNSRFCASLFLFLLTVGPLFFLNEIQNLVTLTNSPVLYVPKKMHLTLSQVQKCVS